MLSPTPCGPREAVRALDPDSVEVWIFDLDNTLYPADCNLFAQVDRRMCTFIQDLLALGQEDARRLQKRYFHEHGTTLRGLMDNHGVDPDTFLSFVHGIDFSPVPAAPDLGRALDALDARKLVYTNATVPYAERVLERLGLGGHFEAIFDIVAADYRPKPEPESYRRMVERYGIDPARAVLVEDIARNLIPAAELGMTTVWIAHESDWSHAGARDDCIHHVTDDLAAWLGQLVAPPADGGA
jgi:putative hydrolase of the HAD superfamily